MKYTVYFVAYTSVEVDAQSEDEAWEVASQEVKDEDADWEYSEMDWEEGESEE